MSSQGPSTLSDNVLYIIATCLRDTATNAHLFAFQLVCKRWHHIGIPILYRNIALRDTTLEAFGKCFNASKYASYVRSLTLGIEVDLRLYSSIENPLPPLPPLQERFQAIVSLIPSFENLASFSMALASSPRHSIRRATIIELLHALPESCINLEIDTGGQDVREQDEEAHVCDAIRGVLPRMQNVRIRTFAMCPAIFGTDKGHGFTPQSLPKLKTLVVQCSRLGGLKFLLCSKHDWISGATARGIRGIAWPSITHALSRIAQQTELHNARIYAVIGAFGDDRHQLCQTEIRADMMNKESWAFPITSAGSEAEYPGSHLERLHDGSELMTKSKEIERIVEGRTWKDTLCRARIPAVILQNGGKSSFAPGCIERESSSKSQEQWRIENTRTCELWVNEDEVGTKLMIAEKKSKGEDYLAIRPIKEITPEGWKRTHAGTSLKRV